MKTFTLIILVLSPSSVFASAVTTSHPLATEAAFTILKDGGSASDAACSAIFALNVVQPYFTGIGAGGFALVHEKSHTLSLDFRSVAPSVTKTELFLGAEGKPLASGKNTGPNSVGVPGLVAACARLNHDYGKLPWKNLFTSAIRYAKEGFSVTQMFQEELADQWERISPFAFTRSILQGKDLKGIKKGEILKQPELANTFEELAKEGGESFYTGNFSKKWLADAKAMGVPISELDLKLFKPLLKDPIKFNYQNFGADTMDLPASSGLTVAGVLRYEDHYYQNHKKLKFTDDLVRSVLFIEATRIFNELRNEKLADRKFTKIEPRFFLDSKAEKKIWNKIDANVEKRFLQASAVKKMNNKDEKTEKHPSEQNSHTAHINVIDNQGQMIAITTSINDIFGSGITLPKTGFVLNSDLADFDSDPQSVNAPAAGKRSRSNMSPTLIYEISKNVRTPIAILGAAGGPLIPQTLVQFVELYFRYGFSAKEAIETARINLGKLNDQIEIEKSASPELVGKLKQCGYDVTLIDTNWTVFQAIVRKNSKSPWEATTEPRYDSLGAVR